MQNIQQFQNWLGKYENVLLEGFVNFGGAVAGNIGGNIGRLPARRAVRGNGRVAASAITGGGGLQSKVADVLKDHPGIAAPEIAKLAGIPGQRAQALLARMRANKTLKATGKRGSRHYWLKGTQPAASAST